MPLSPCVNINAEQQGQLLDIARRSIEHGFSSGRPLEPELEPLAENLRQPAAVFITLTRNGDLRGCIGSLQAIDALAVAVANSAFNASFRDRRFSSIEAAELDEIDIEIAVLSPLEPIAVDSRQALLEILQPGVDGLLMEDHGYRSTFLPKVWEKVASPDEFLEQLMIKAGLPPGYWSDSIRFQRYHCHSFAEN